MKYKCRAIKLFAIYRDEKNEDCSPLGQLDVQRGGGKGADKCKLQTHHIHIEYWIRLLQASS